MSLTLILVPNLLTPHEEDYIGVVVEESPPRLITDFENPIELFGLTIEDGKLKKTDDPELSAKLLDDGRSLFTSIFEMRMCVVGNFRGINDTFDDKRHSKRLLLTAGRQLKKQLSNKMNK